MRPAYGVHLPCNLVRVVDADTVDLTCLTKLRWRLRLKDINAPEKSTAPGLKAMHFAESVLEEAAGELSASVELPEKAIEAIRNNESVNPLDAASFNRVVGDVWIGESDRLTDILVNAGHAERV